MGFLKKLQFWKRRKNSVSPPTVDVGVSTEEPEKLDVATMTDNEIVGHETNADEASLLENAQGCESVPFGGWPADHVEWNAYEGYPSFADDSPASGMYAYEGYPSFADDPPANGMYAYEGYTSFADDSPANGMYAYEDYPSFADDSPANGMYAYEGYQSYAYNVTPIQYQEWCYVTHVVSL